MRAFHRSYAVALAIGAAIFSCVSSYIYAEESAKPYRLHVSPEFYAIYPKTNEATGELAEKIKRGEYLARMGDCIACHSNVADKEPAYAGGLPIATPFGTFYSPNITPDVETGIGSWSEADFIRALKEGRDPKGHNYFPVFPYIYFANVSDEDIKDMYAYFMNIPPIHRKNTPLPFPFNVPGARLSLWGWKMLFFYPQKPYKPDLNQSAEWNRGQYIVDGLGHCSMCHTPLNPLGAPITKHYLTGGFIDGYWAFNITKQGLASASDDEVADVFAKNELINGAGRVAGPMSDVNHDSLNYLTREDQLAIVTYIKTVESVDPFYMTPSDDPPSLARGRQVYLNSCIICHQNGEMTAPRIGNGENFSMRLKESGLKALYRNVINGYNSMPPKGACVSCSDNDLISAVDYILNESLSRSQWLDVKAQKSKALEHERSGKMVYAEKCAVCHDNGSLGAPIIGNKQAWDTILADKTFDILVQNTVNSEHHPKRGACNKCSTEEIMDAIKYILQQSTTHGNYTLW